MGTSRSYEGQIWGDSERAALAINWKTYWASKIQRHLGESVLEVGAGLGANTLYLFTPLQKQWLCLEPDPLLVEQIPTTLSSQPWRDRVKSRLGILQDLPAEPLFDTILYIDVLEHIEYDLDELNEALKRLRPGGKIIVLSPAYQFLYNIFDESLGHYRRYNKRTLRACTPVGSKLQKLFYLDSIGVFASFANKFFLHQRTHTEAQMLFWDRYLVTTSRWVDPLIGFQAGKSLIGIWTKL